MNELHGEDYERFKRILWNVREFGHPPLSTRAIDRLNISYLIAIDMVEWEGDPMGTFIHLTDKGRQWLKEQEDYDGKRR